MIADIFAAALQFFCDKIDMFLGILTTDITTFQDGAIWRAVSALYDAMVAMGITIAGMLIWIGLLQSTSRYAELKRGTVWLQFLIEVILANAILYYGKYLLLECIKIGQGMTKRMMNVTGMVADDGTSIFHITIPEQLNDAIGRMRITRQIGVFIIVIIASVWIVISTCGVLLSVYGRLFNMYLLIAISPLPVSTVISKSTRFVFYNFLKTFLAVVLEALVMVLVLYLFQAFFTSGFNVGWSRSMGSGSTGAISDDSRVFGYMAEMSFLFLMLFGMLKGTDKLVNRIFGI